MKQLREDLKKGIVHNEHSKFNQLINKYKEKFGQNPATEPSSYSEDTWCIILEKCIEQEKTVDELFIKQLCKNWKESTVHDEHLDLNQLIDAYQKKFGDTPAIESSDYLEDMWYIILEECIKQEKTIDELLEIEDSFNKEWYD